MQTFILLIFELIYSKAKFTQVLNKMLKRTFQCLTESVWSQLAKLWPYNILCCRSSRLWFKFSSGSEYLLRKKSNFCCLSAIHSFNFLCNNVRKASFGRIRHFWRCVRHQCRFLGLEHPLRIHSDSPGAHPSGKFHAPRVNPLLSYLLPPAGPAIRKFSIFVEVLTVETLDKALPNSG